MPPSGESPYKSFSNDTPQSGMPFNFPGDRLRAEVERVVGHLREQGEKALDLMGVRHGGPWVPDVDVIEMPEFVVVMLDVPGVASSSIGVEVFGNMLNVSGKRDAVVAGPGGILHDIQRPAGEFRRSVPLPVPVNVDAVTAAVQNGVLTVRLARTTSVAVRTVPVSDQLDPAASPVEGIPTTKTSETGEAP